MVKIACGVKNEVFEVISLRYEITDTTLMVLVFEAEATLDGY